MRKATCLLGAACCGLLLAAGCGPMYNTEYTFVPPETPTGQTCVFQCENSKLQCEQIEDMKQERCEDRADREYERCKDREKEKHCYRSYCSVDYSRCETRHRGCYQSCGGKVEEHKKCVAFCN